MASLPPTPRWPIDHPDIPHIADDEEFGDVVGKLSFYFTDAITLPHTFEDLRTLPCGRILSPLIAHISDSVHHPAIISALLALKTHFDALEDTSDEPGINEARGYACEFVAWQFLTNLSERESIDFLFHELPRVSPPGDEQDSAENGMQNGGTAPSNEETPLIGTPSNQRSSYFGTDRVTAKTNAATGRSDDFTSQFEKLSALEIASVSGAKKFLSQRPVQKIINGVWRGDIVLWESLSVNSVKSPKLYNRKRADAFSRLRVPRYLKVYETSFFATFLVLYYAVLVRRNFHHVTSQEVLLYIWIAGFAYDEFGEWSDAGQTSFYASDFWWTWDISIVFVATAFCVLRIVGLTMGSAEIIDLAYDVLGLEALFLVPRIFSLLSLNPYFGTLIPCLKEMTKDFVKFLSLVIILYLGFLTTFTLLARDQFTPREMSWILVKVFFGSSYLGFTNVVDSSPVFGPPTMLVFVALTNILLITSLISLLSNSLEKGKSTALVEPSCIPYCLAKSVGSVTNYHLNQLFRIRFGSFFFESFNVFLSTTGKCTCFSILGADMHVQNLIPLVLRPLRLLLPSGRLRSTRIILLKTTHLPFVGAIWAYEQLSRRRCSNGVTSISGPETQTTTKRPLRSSVNPPRPLTSGPHSIRREMSHLGNRPNTRDGPSETDVQLKSLVVKLTTQVEQLNAMVLRLQEQREPSRAA
ncbi:hypothetical protein P154DRAFT_478076, partial [Amniculicola lignicola CBS 123094]